jgi:Putative DNA-binding domain
MSLEKPLEFVTEADLQRLITDGVAERAIIEYKSMLPGNSDGEKKEFLADVSSFANALGGHIIYGMEEAAGLPTSLSGVEVADVNSEKLRLENIIRTGIAPRIPGVQVGEPIRLSSGRIALIIQVPKSWISPHMVTFQGNSKFHSRNSGGKYPLDVQELRSAFLSSAATTDRLRDFRAERLSRIVSGNTPAKLQPGLRVIVHVIPLSAFETREKFDGTDLRKCHQPGVPQPIFSSQVYNSRFNFDGYLIVDQFEDSSTVVAAYLQLFRNGIFESVNTLLHFGQGASKSLPSLEFEGKLLGHLPNYFEAMKKLGVRPPVFVAVSLIGTFGYSLSIPPEATILSAHLGRRTIDDDSLILPEVMVETFESDLAEALKPVFDSVWNAAGGEKSIYYEGSKWVGVEGFRRQIWGPGI